jgi:hypothetical protein
MGDTGELSADEARANAGFPPLDRPDYVGPK